MLCMAFLPYFEQLFKITTQQTLLELSNLNHPLLKKLMLRALGTYQHSLMVANLAEAAAEEISANPILCRVGAYYHDIGKIKRRAFFSENQFTDENPHENIAPKMSQIIIANHIKDGIELAIRYKLPPAIKNIIEQHHGTSVISFFYEKAVLAKDQNDSDPLKDDFRYPGPKPNFKESGILMLADSVEAAVRSLIKPNLTKIENLLDTIFNDKIKDKQLSECPLTLSEIEVIKATFLTVFKGIYHNRVNYQEELEALSKTKQSQQAIDAI